MGSSLPRTGPLVRPYPLLPALLALLAAAALGLALTAGLVLASGPASDTAGEPAYADGWQDGDDGGTGFGAGWDLVTSTADSLLAGHVISTSTLNGDGDTDADGDIDTAGPSAWGLYADPGQYAHADRPFSGALSLGSQFSLRMDNGSVSGTGQVGFSLRNAANDTLLAVYLDGANGTYTIQAQDSLDSGLAATDEGLDITVTLVTTDSYRLVLTTLDGSSSAVFTGALASPAGGQGITRLHLFNNGAGVAAGSVLFFNQLDLVPASCFAQVVGGGSYASADGYAVQAAVEAAPVGAAIHVAGTCAGVFNRNGSDQTVYLTQSVTLQGGYNPLDWSHDPANYTTTLDALSLGRVMRIEAPGSDIVLEDLVLQGGYATSGDGGGLFNESQSLTINRSLIYGNHTDYNGGGLYNFFSALTLDDTTVLSNTAGYDGGGIYSGFGPVVNAPDLPCLASLAQNGLYPSSVTVQNGSELVGNTAEGFGGGLYGFESLLVVDDSLVQHNFAISGGGIYSAGYPDCLAASVVDSLQSAEPFEGALLTVSGGSLIDSNIALPVDGGGNAPEYAQGMGGGIFNYQATAIVLDSTVSNNIGLFAGGGAANLQGQFIISATEVYSNVTLLFGGGLASLLDLPPLPGDNLPTGNLPVCAVSQPSAVTGPYGLIVLGGSELRQNIALAYGGGLANDNTLVIVDDSLVTGNVAGNGAGLYNHEQGCYQGGDDAGLSAIMTVQNGSEIRGNMATWSGLGAITEAATARGFDLSAPALVLGEGLGGGVFNAENTLAVYDSLIQDNVAEDEGGGLASLGGYVVISTTQVLSNTALNGSGGGFLLDYTYYYTTAPNCLAAPADSGDYADLIVYDSVISHNWADDAGGGVASWGPTMRLDGTTVADNHAELGGGLFHEEFGCGNGPAAPDQSESYGAAITVVNGSALIGNEAAHSDFGSEPDDHGNAPNIFTYLFQGGGLYSFNSAVRVLDSLIAENTAGDDGAGVAALGSYVVISNTQVLSNTALGGFGGGVYTEYGEYYRGPQAEGSAVAAPDGSFWADLVIRGGSEISHNSAGYAGGGLSSTGPSILVDASRVSDNRAQLGGGVYHSGTCDCAGKPEASLSDDLYEAVTLRNASVVSGNRANAGDDQATPDTLAASPDTFDDLYQGGGIYSKLSAVGVYTSSVYGNSAVDEGGGLFALDTWVHVQDSALYSNTAASGGGAALLDGRAIFTNTTISSNAATNGNGGGLYLAEDAANVGAPDSATDDAYLGNVTVADNTATAAGQNLYSDSEEYSLRNTLIAGSPAGNCAATVNTLGYNLEDGDTCSLSDATDQPETSAMLGALADNGGATLTHALLRGSPAIDTGVCDFDHDQRGEPRPEDGGSLCDIGAYEYKAYTLWLPVVMHARPDLVGSFTLSPNKTNFAAGEAVVVTVVVTNQGKAANSAGFWVDFSLNPANPPAANRPWYDNCGVSPCHGLAWYVAVSLAPGQSITLTSTPGSYAPGHTVWTGAFPAGTTDVYLYVDSWNPTSATAAVLESNENNNGAELHGLVVGGTPAAAQGAEATRFADRWILPAK